MRIEILLRLLLPLVLFFNDCYAEFSFNEHPLLETKRLVLRKMTLEDAEDLFVFLSDKQVLQYAAMPLHVTVEDSEGYIRGAWDAFARQVRIAWVIEEKETKAIIGVCSFFDIVMAHKRAEIAYIFAQNAWNKGYATETAQKLIDFGLNTLQLCRIQASCHPDNAQSAKVLEKCGMQYEGLLRNYKVQHDGPSDRKMYSIISKPFAKL